MPRKSYQLTERDSCFCVTLVVDGVLFGSRLLSLCVGGEPNVASVFFVEMIWVFLIFLEYELLCDFSYFQPSFSRSL